MRNRFFIQAAAVGLCALLGLSACDQVVVSAPVPADPLEALLARADEALPDTVRWTNAGRVKDISAFIEAREARILLAIDALEHYMRLGRERKEIPEALFRHGAVWRRALERGRDTEDLVQALPELAYLSAEDLSFIERRLDAYEKTLSRYKNAMEARINRLGWGDDIKVTRVMMENGFLYGLEYKAYMAEISDQRLREFLLDLKSVSMAAGREALWEAILHQDHDALGAEYNLEHQYPARMLFAIERHEIFRADMPDGLAEYPFTHLVEMGLAQELALKPIGRGYFTLIYTGLLDYTLVEQAALKVRLHDLLATLIKEAADE